MIVKDLDDKSCLEELREEYVGFKDKYGLPGFSELNELFDIEDVDVESEFLLRRIRRVISEKIAGYLRFIEVILNPSNAPMFFFKLVKKLDREDMEVLGEIYNVLGSLEIEVAGLDLSYSESREADFVKKVYSVFNEDIRGKLLKVVERLGNGEGVKKSENNGSYFG